MIDESTFDARDSATEPMAVANMAVSAADVLQNWRVFKAAGSELTLEAARRVGEELLRLGEPVVAYDFTLSALELHSDDVRLRQLQALALSRCGVPGKANSLLRELRDEGHTDEETLGLLARTYKDLWLRAADPESREGSLRQAHELYLTAYCTTGGIYSGINAASTALWLDELETAAELAREVRSRCLADLERSGDAPGDSYWALATLGEACLLMGDLEAAKHWYACAAAAAKERLGDLHSTRRQARLVLASLGLDPHALDAALPMPKVALFCGWPQEQPGLGLQAITPAAEADALAAIQQMLSEYDVGVGFASAASDAEVLFFESLRERHGLAYAVLPFEKDFFLNEPASGAIKQWRERFKAALGAATQVHTVSEFGVPSNSTAVEYAQALMYGLARLQADTLETDLIGLAVEGDSTGRRAVDRWRQWGLEVKTLGLPGISPQSAIETAVAPVVAAHDQPVSRIVAILFADVKGFSKLKEGQVPLFFRHFMGLVAELLAGIERPPLLRNTWGDGLYVVFDNVRDAGLFALRLCERSTAIDWRQKGLPEDLAIRVGLHAGPAWHCDDPVTGTQTYTGIHVSRAARIEPITPPGQAYASQAFAALAAAEGARELAFEYVGRTPLAKDYGTLPIYHVRPRA